MRMAWNIMAIALLALTPGADGRAVEQTNATRTTSFSLNDHDQPQPLLESSGSAILSDRCAGCGAPCDSCTSRVENCGQLCAVCQASQPWAMPQPHALQRLGFKVGGWVQQGVTLNADQPHDGFNGPVATNDLDRQYQLNQAWMYIDKPADNGGEGWALGAHIDRMYGSDWRFGINHGLEDRINGFDHQRNGTVIPQMYVEVAYNKLSVKLGHYAGILDYEAIPAPMNPLFSHSYSYGYTVPQLVTGAAADYKLTKQWSFQAGFHRGWMLFEDFNDEMDFMGGVKWRSVDKRFSVAYALSTGPQDPAGRQDRFVYSLVAQAQLTEKFKYVLVHNLGFENQAFGTEQDAEWYGLNQYFLYTINPRWSAAMRVEWLRDDDGARIAGPGNIPGVTAFDGRGFVGSFYEVTCGLNWRPRPNILFRPEVRWDWFDGEPGPTNLPFNDGTSDDQFLFAVDMIITF